MMEADTYNLAATTAVITHHLEIIVSRLVIRGATADGSRTYGNQPSTTAEADLLSMFRGREGDSGNHEVGSRHRGGKSSARCGTTRSDIMINSLGAILRSSLWTPLRPCSSRQRRRS
eukprot:TRINITY_DN22196_c0_g3_i1.p1 TRINITY_DN22196_c0_g3~~TRINITY_DN22196_c0_g3_i1.p1  ORF type:complete len:117 (+),score=11.30 TRINITY_DN22196_c0_g3_i1:145-495(+)